MTAKNKIYTYGDGSTKMMTRIRADDGKAVTNDGVTLWKSIDVESVDGWYEVDDPSEEDEDVTAADVLTELEGLL